MFSSISELRSMLSFSAKPSELEAIFTNECSTLGEETAYLNLVTKAASDSAVETEILSIFEKYQGKKQDDGIKRDLFAQHLIKHATPTDDSEAITETPTRNLLQRMIRSQVVTTNDFQIVGGAAKDSSLVVKLQSIYREDFGAISSQASKAAGQSLLYSMTLSMANTVGNFASQHLGEFSRSLDSHIQGLPRLDNMSAARLAMTYGNYLQHMSETPAGTNFRAPPPAISPTFDLMDGENKDDDLEVEVSLSVTPASSTHVSPAPSPVFDPNKIIEDEEIERLLNNLPQNVEDCEEEQGYIDEALRKSLFVPAANILQQLDEVIETLKGAPHTSTPRTSPELKRETGARDLTFSPIHEDEEVEERSGVDLPPAKVSPEVSLRSSPSDPLHEPMASTTARPQVFTKVGQQSPENSTSSFDQKITLMGSFPLPAHLLNGENDDVSPENRLPKATFVASSVGIPHESAFAAREDGEKSPTKSVHSSTEVEYMDGSTSTDDELMTAVEGMNKWLMIDKFDGMMVAKVAVWALMIFSLGLVYGLMVLVANSIDIAKERSIQQIVKEHNNGSGSLLLKELSDKV